MRRELCPPQPRFPPLALPLLVFGVLASFLGDKGKAAGRIVLGEWPKQGLPDSGVVAQVQWPTLDADAWLALGNYLMGHTEGVLSPAALYAYRRAAEVDPQHPGPAFFYGMALISNGKPAEGRALWARLKLRGDAVMDYALRDLSADERTLLLSLLTRIRDSLTTP